MRGARSLIAAAMMPLALLTSAACPTHRADHQGRIVFSRTVNAETGASAIISIRPDGSDAIRVVSGQVAQPRWAPRGHRLLVTTLTSDFNARPAVVSEHRGHRARLRVLGDPRSTVSLYCMAWSPDERTLACGGSNDEAWATFAPGLFTVRSSNGRNLRRITTAFDAPDRPGDYSPDGKRIVFLRIEEQFVDAALFVMKVDGTGLRQLSTWGDTWMSPGSWSPNGRWILFSDAEGVHLVRPDGSGLHRLRLHHAPPLTIVDDPRWSPDGRRIVFVGYSSPSRTDLYVMRADGTRITRIPHTSGANSPDWGTRR